MTPDDLALLIELKLVEPTGQPGEYKLTHAGRVMRGEQATKPGIRDTQQWIDGATRQAETKLPTRQPRPLALLRRVK